MDVRAKSFQTWSNFKRKHVSGRNEIPHSNSSIGITLVSIIDFETVVCWKLELANIRFVFSNSYLDDIFVSSTATWMIWCMRSIDFYKCQNIPII